MIRVRPQVLEPLHQHIDHETTDLQVPGEIELPYQHIPLQYLRVSALHCDISSSTLCSAQLIYGICDEGDYSQSEVEVVASRFFFCEEKVPAGITAVVKPKT